MLTEGRRPARPTGAPTITRANVDPNHLVLALIRGGTVSRFGAQEEAALGATAGDEGLSSSRPLARFARRTPSARRGLPSKWPSSIMSTFGSISFAAWRPCRRSPMPTIFLSSTVADFEDLRGALRDWLQVKGLHVLASDATDFDKAGDANSYAACFAAIKTADHFLLLIGDRRGGIYEEATEPISITHAEYRVALEESSRRHLPIHAFVRKRTWNEKHLCETGRLAPTDDLRHQIAFLREVGRVAEMKKAISASHQRPANNWIHQFDTFSDIRSALEVNLGLRHDLETEALRNAVGLELEQLIAHFLNKTKDGKCSWRSSLTRRLRNQIQIPVSALHQLLELSREDVTLLFFSALAPLMGFLPEMQALKHATYWHHFAEHDPVQGNTRMSPMQKSIGRVFSLPLTGPEGMGRIGFRDAKLTRSRAGHRSVGGKVLVAAGRNQVEACGSRFPEESPMVTTGLTTMSHTGRAGFWKMLAEPLGMLAA